MLWQLGMSLLYWKKLNYLWKYLEHGRSPEDSKTQVVVHAGSHLPWFSDEAQQTKDWAVNDENLRKWQILTHTVITVDLNKYQQYIVMTEKAAATEEWWSAVHRAPLPPHQVGRSLSENQKQAQLLRKGGWHSCASRLRRWHWRLEEAEGGWQLSKINI